MHDSRVMWFYSVFWCNSNKITSMCLFLCIYSNIAITHKESIGLQENKINEIKIKFFK